MAVAEESNVDEAIIAEFKAVNNMNIDLKDEKNTEDYEETMKIYIENIDTIEKRNKA